MGEAVATLTATHTARTDYPLLQITDSKTTLESVTSRRTKYEDEGFINQKNADITQAIIGAALARTAPTAIRWVKGHNGHPGNEAADRLAGAATAKAHPDEVDLSVPESLRLTGAKLTKMTQKLAYKALRQKKAAATTRRPRTADRVSRIMQDLEDDFKTKVTEAYLWWLLRKLQITKDARQWLWMVIHDGYMVGSHWLRL